MNEGRGTVFRRVRHRHKIFLLDVCSLDARQAVQPDPLIALPIHMGSLHQIPPRPILLHPLCHPLAFNLFDFDETISHSTRTCMFARVYVESRRSSI